MSAVLPSPKEIELKLQASSDGRLFLTVSHCRADGNETEADDAAGYPVWMGPAGFVVAGWWKGKWWHNKNMRSSHPRVCGSI